MGNAIIKFESTLTGNVGINGLPEIDQQFKVEGERADLFSLLCEAMHNPEFRRMAFHALRYATEHDKDNCPHCRPQN